MFETRVNSSQTFRFGLVLVNKSQTYRSGQTQSGLLTLGSRRVRVSSRVFNGKGHEYLLKSLDGVAKELYDTQSKLEDVQKIARDKSKYLEKKLDQVEAELKQVKSEHAQVVLNHEKEVEEYRYGLMKSATISVLQARVKMALRARDPGFKQKDWDIKAWKEKIKSLGEKEVVYEPVHVTYPEDASKNPKDAEVKEAEAKVAEVVKDLQVGDEGYND